MAWVVMIEEIYGSGQGMRWSAKQATSDFPNRDEARAQALHLTGEYVPQHPWSERNRTVYRRSPDSYLVHVVGATMEFHFSLSVAERIVPETGQPDALHPREQEQGSIPHNDGFFGP